MQSNLAVHFERKADLLCSSPSVLVVKSFYVLNIESPNVVFGLAPIFPYTFYHLTHYWFAAADIPVANDTPVHYADA
ncbi:hypothetical protein, partial [Citrobacter freundii]|uniref:hypothetical protein n=1 Tax=Citrobacter freundii TaxID=546 RepID=UPI0039837FFF